MPSVIRAMLRPAMRLLQGTELKDYFRDPTKVTSWWRPEEGAYRFWHDQEFGLLDRYLASDGSPLVLDAACGQGRYARYLARKGCRVCALDINPKMLDIARERASREGLADRIEFVEGDVESFAADGRPAFDIVLCMDALDHMADLERAIANLAGLLKSGGTLVTTYTSKESLYGLARGVYTSIAYRRRDDAVDIAQTYSWPRFAAALTAAGITIEHRVGIGLLMAPQERIALGPAGRLLRMLSRIDIALKGHHADNWLCRHCAVVTAIGTRRGARSVPPS